MFQPWYTIGFIKLSNKKARKAEKIQGNLDCCWFISVYIVHPKGVSTDSDIGKEF